MFDEREGGATAGGASGEVAISGASGLIGTRLTAALSAGGYRVRRLVRRMPRDPESEILFDPATARIDAAALEGVGAVVHLAGANVAAGRWTRSRKQRIRDSRVGGTVLLAAALGRLRQPPRVLVAASAIGFYGDRGEETVDERSGPGRGFLAETCVAWEAASDVARQAGIRVVQLRIGVVLSADGGALATMLPIFRLGLGGRTGHGRQWISWISIDDLVAIVSRTLEHDDLAGPVNAVAPAPVRNAEFSRVLARVLRRPAVFPVSAWLLRALFGQMAEELLLSSTRAVPRRLEQARYRFIHPKLEAAMRATLNRPRPGDDGGGITAS